MTSAELVKISEALEAAAVELEKVTGGLGSKPEWEAISQLRHASRYVASAALWLRQAPDRSLIQDRLQLGE